MAVLDPPDKGAKSQEAAEAFVENLAEILTDKESCLQHLNLSGLALSASQVLQLIKAARGSPALLGMHLTDCLGFTESLELRAEMLTLLGINYGLQEALNEYLKARAMAVHQLKKEGSGEGLFKGLEPQYKTVVDNLAYKEEVQQGRRVNAYLGFSSLTPIVQNNFVLQRTLGHPELRFESALRN